MDRVKRKPPGDLTVYDRRLRAMALAGQLTEDGMMEAIRILDRAMEIDPAHALIMAGAAYYRAQCHFQGWSTDQGDTAERALKLAWDAVSLDDQDANVQWLAAFAIWTFSRDAERSRELFRRSLSLNPNNAIAQTMAGWVENANGNPEGGRRLIERSMRLNPQ